MLLFFLRGRQDSNLDNWFWRPESCRWTTPPPIIVKNLFLGFLMRSMFPAPPTILTQLKFFLNLFYVLMNVIRNSLTAGTF